MKQEDSFGDKWDTSEKICFNCEHMAYFTDGYAEMEVCSKKGELEFVNPTSFCKDFKNRWKYL